MSLETKRLAVIPARGGSKRIEKKNIKLFCGKPIIQYSLDYADDSGIFDKIHVSTDCPEIARVSTSLGFAPEFMRPDGLADDHATLFDVLVNVNETFLNKGETYEEVWLITACSPLIESGDLVNASMNFTGDPPMIAVSEMPVPPQWSYVRDKDGLLTFLNPEAYALRSQDLPQCYYDTGSFAVFSQDHLKAGSFSANGVRPHFLPRHRAMDIDNLADWYLAEALFTATRS